MLPIIRAFVNLHDLQKETPHSTRTPSADRVSLHRHIFFMRWRCSIKLQWCNKTMNGDHCRDWQSLIEYEFKAFAEEKMPKIVLPLPGRKAIGTKLDFILNREPQNRDVLLNYNWFRKVLLKLKESIVFMYSRPWPGIVPLYWAAVSTLEAIMPSQF